jgi:phage pi2 protein 07
MNSISKLIIAVVLSVVLFIGFLFFIKFRNENKTLREMISRLEAESRIAEVLVTKVEYDELTRRNFTTIKFLEYDSQDNSLEPRYFTFPGNIIQFQSLVIRFDDLNIKRGDRLKGKSAYLFWKIFMLDGKNTQEYEITKAYEVPEGYKINNAKNSFENGLWEKFWIYALHYDVAKSKGIKNAQIEAPGVIFIPGMLYTIKIEHDGGMRIDSKPLPTILRGEKIPK